MWKNKHADGPVSAKKPAKVKEKQKARRAERKKLQSHDDISANSDDGQVSSQQA